MDTTPTQEKHTGSKHCCYRNGRLYFTNQVERRIFFGGTLIMLLWSLLVKIGLL